MGKFLCSCGGEGGKGKGKREKGKGKREKGKGKENSLKVLNRLMNLSVALPRTESRKTVSLLPLSPFPFPLSPH
jgi:hypothetical protein